MRACLLSKPDELDESAQVLLGDEMGALLTLYAASDVAFVGGSLVSRGGHNMLEPAALGLPVLTGPHYFNFTDIGERLIVSGAARQVTDADSLASELLQLLQSTAARSQMGMRGARVVRENRGALERLMGVMAEYIYGERTGLGERLKVKGES